MRLCIAGTSRIYCRTVSVWYKRKKITTRQTEKEATRELTKAEEKLYAKEVRAAKIMELSSWIKHSSFSSRQIKNIKAKLMTRCG